MVSEVYFYLFKTERQVYNVFFWILERKIMIAKALPSVAPFTEVCDQANNYIWKMLITHVSKKCKDLKYAHIYYMIEFSDSTSVFKSKSRTNIKPSLLCKLIARAWSLWNTQRSYGTWHRGVTAPAPALLSNPFTIIILSLALFSAIGDHTILNECRVLHTYVCVHRPVTF